MSKFTHKPIVPIRYTTTVFVPVDEFGIYKKKTNKKNDKFYIHKRRVINGEVVLEIRSLRINEFCQLLTDWGISWRVERSSKNLYNGSVK